MAHFHIDYSPNLESRMDIAALCRVLRDTAVETGVFAPAGLRVRAIACDHVVMADEAHDHAFLDISIRLRAGRSEQDKQRVVEMVFDAASKFCTPVLENSSFMLSLELRDIDAELSRKVSSIRKYLSGDVRE